MSDTMNVEIDIEDILEKAWLALEEAGKTEKVSNVLEVAKMDVRWLLALKEYGERIIGILDDSAKDLENLKSIIDQGEFGRTRDFYQHFGAGVDSSDAELGIILRSVAETLGMEPLAVLLGDYSHRYIFHNIFEQLVVYVERPYGGGDFCSRVPYDRTGCRIEDATLRYAKLSQVFAYYEGGTKENPFEED
jgi:hypothetical protein